jgi:hypothetical protein
VLVSLLGTPYFPQVDGGILFLEDVGEHPYKIERMLNQLLLAGVLQKQKAIVFGQFTEFKLTTHDKGFKLQTVIDWLRMRSSAPCCKACPSAMCPPRCCCPWGAGVAVGRCADLLGAYPLIAGRRTHGPKQGARWRVWGDGWFRGQSMWEFAAYPLLALVFVGIFSREVIAPASRNHCDRRWLLMSSALACARCWSPCWWALVLGQHPRRGAVRCGPALARAAGGPGQLRADQLCLLLVAPRHAPLGSAVAGVSPAAPQCPGWRP